MAEEKFYRKTWFAVVMIFVFWPVGLFLLFRYKHGPIAVRITVAGLFALVIIGGIVAYSSDPTPEVTKEKVEAKPASTTPKEVAKPKAKPKEKKVDNTVMSGENGFLAEDSFIGLGEDKKNYDEMFKYINANNLDALKGMMLDGRVSFAKKGTPITVVDHGFINAKIQVIATGDRGWVPVEYLAKTEPK